MKKGLSCLVLLSIMVYLCSFESISNNIKDRFNESLFVKPYKTKKDKLNTTLTKQRADSLNDAYLVLNKQQMANKGIFEIKHYSTKDCNRDDSAVCFEMFTFKYGRLIKELSFDEAKLNINSANDLAYIYSYKKDNSGKYILYFRTGDAYNGYSQLEHIVTYNYADGKLRGEIYREGTLSYSPVNRRATSSYSQTTSYFYNNSGQIDHSKVVYAGAGIQYKYFIYDKNILVGYFPSETTNSDYTAKGVFFLDYKKLKELQKIGFNDFKNKYFSKEQYQEIVDKCYTPVKNEELLINGKPINDFLKKNKKTGAKYIVFEIADNYFLFYKLIN